MKSEDFSSKGVKIAGGKKSRAEHNAKECLVNNVSFVYFNVFCIYVVVLNMQGMVFP